MWFLVVELYENEEEPEELNALEPMEEDDTVPFGIGEYKSCQSFLQWNEHVDTRPGRFRMIGP